MLSKNYLNRLVASECLQVVGYIVEKDFNRYFQTLHDFTKIDIQHRLQAENQKAGRC